VAAGELDGRALVARTEYTLAPPDTGPLDWLLAAGHRVGTGVWASTLLVRDANPIFRRSERMKLGVLFPQT
jgi:hypothetical protein